MGFSKFFSNLQEAPWYTLFLQGVINEVDSEKTLLDIGTGSGKLIQILFVDKSIECIGVDTNENMLNEAKIKMDNTNIKLLKIEANKKLPFDNKSFDYITICSVLFHLNEENIDLMIKDAERLLKENGKIIVLTPTGKENLIRLTKHYFSFKNLGIYIWYLATKNKAKLWSGNRFLRHAAYKNRLIYRSEVVMNGFAQIEVLERNYK